MEEHAKKWDQKRKKFIEQYYHAKQQQQNFMNDRFSYHNAFTAEKKIFMMQKTDREAKRE